MVVLESQRPLSYLLLFITIESVLPWGMYGKLLKSGHLAYVKNLKKESKKITSFQRE
jgi:hypothetical protein